MTPTDKPALPQLHLAQTDRVLILAPHPDDETIATGGIIQQAVALGLPLHVVWLTNGDNNETTFMAYRKGVVRPGVQTQGMGLLRHEEAVAATGILGLSPDNLTFLGYPDFRTLKIWNEHWRDAPACESMFTRTSVVPYANAFRPGTPYKSDEILADLKTIIRGFQPTVIFTSHPGDHNPDHLSLYLFTRIAQWDLQAENQAKLWPYLVHHPAWPEPESFRPDLPMIPPERLDDEPGWTIARTSPEQIVLKRQATRAHKTQLPFDTNLLDSFVRSNELFGGFHDIDLRDGSDSAEVVAGTAPLLTSQYSHNERVKLLGTEHRTIRVNGDHLEFSVHFSRPVGDAVAISAYLFGYRPDVPFSQMPKLHLKLTGADTTMHDQATLLHNPPLTVKHGLKEFSVSMPLSLLGDPKWLLASARSSLADTPLDWVAWRAMRLPGSPD